LQSASTPEQSISEENPTDSNLLLAHIVKVTKADRFLC